MFSSGPGGGFGGGFTSQNSNPFAQTQGPTSAVQNPFQPNAGAKTAFGQSSGFGNQPPLPPGGMAGAPPLSSSGFGNQPPLPPGGLAGAPPLPGGGFGGDAIHGSANEREHELIEVPSFVAQQNMEQLGQTLKSLNEMYDESNKMGDPAYSSPFEAECRAYFILCTLDNGRGMDVLKYVKNLPQYILESPHIKFAMRVFVARHTGDYYQFFSLLRQATYLQSCLLFRYIPNARSSALLHMNRAYRGQLYPLEDLVELLCFDDIEHAYSVCKHHKLRISGSPGDGDDSTVIVKFGGDFETDIQLRRNNEPLEVRASKIYVGMKQGNYLRRDVCRGVTEHPSNEYPGLSKLIQDFERSERAQLYPNRPENMPKFLAMLRGQLLLTQQSFDLIDLINKQKKACSGFLENRTEKLVHRSLELEPKMLQRPCTTAIVLFSQTTGWHLKLLLFAAATAVSTYELKKRIYSCLLPVHEQLTKGGVENQVTLQEADALLPWRKIFEEIYTAFFETVSDITIYYPVDWQGSVPSTFGLLDAPLPSRLELPVVTNRSIKRDYSKMKLPVKVSLKSFKRSFGSKSLNIVGESLQKYRAVGEMKRLRVEIDKERAATSQFQRMLRQELKRWNTDDGPP
ncbi:hypothetical protein BBO99_00001296 [Phytophthora kernoviae]|uniref:SAC3/GANP/THP3 conserved domain-containing protein n=1 Tax=Phytophthora kernoviae TaxID=325452 RepID=A0A3R7K0M6_9STRA|nr:hypothetical protein BBI17_001093 [Phytophthora kernoviae]RLN84466.1 hypothetical protein BBO99_00001296 [Phytophthora kernoviae]